MGCLHRLRKGDIGHRGKRPYDNAYSTSPINYLQLNRVPTVDDMDPIINGLKRGEYFVTFGKVLLSSNAVEGTGLARTITAEVAWTFPLDFGEVVWGDGEKTDWQTIPTIDLPPFGRKRFPLPFDATGQKWVRFAAWDVATNGALVQPVSLSGTGRETPGDGR